MLMLVLGEKPAKHLQKEGDLKFVDIHVVKVKYAFEEEKIDANECENGSCI